MCTVADTLLEEQGRKNNRRQETVQTCQSHRHIVEIILETWKLCTEFIHCFCYRCKNIRLNTLVTVKKKPLHKIRLIYLV